MAVGTFEKKWAEAFVASYLSELRSLPGLVKNSAVVGALMEAMVRDRIRQSCNPLHVATGAILPEGEDCSEIPQIDTIYWSTVQTGLPPVFVYQDFALVPQSSARGVIEIRKSPGKLKEFRAALEARRGLLTGGYKPNVLGLVMHADKDITSQEPVAAWPHQRRETGAPAVANLLTATKTGYRPNVRGILVLGHFLGFMTRMQ